MSSDLLSGAVWECSASGRDWIPARVPGTAAGALRDAGQWDTTDERDFDTEDWSFRTRFPRPDGSGPWRLHVDGVATVADVLLNGELLLHSERMFAAYDIDIGGDQLQDDNELIVQCHALAPLLEVKRPRPRWRTRLLRDHRLRWYRTTFLGRIPGWAGVAAPVGPWRPITLSAVPSVDLLSRRLAASVSGTTGVVDVELSLRSSGAAPSTVMLSVGDVRAGLDVAVTDGVVVARGQLEVANAALWWPHTHGEPNLYPVTVAVDGTTIDLGEIGFRSLHVERDDDGFGIVVNGQPVFCRGACWVPLDVVSLVSAEPDVRATLELVRAAGMNMVRITGTMVYEDPRFWDLCDELGLLVWQDLMFANIDPPDDDEFASVVVDELAQVLGGLQGRPSLAVICGSSELEQQAAMLGLPRERWELSLLNETVPREVERWLPGTPYVPSSPTGGDLPINVDAGVAHYFGVGAYERPIEDARRAGVRFASECLAFANPPERETVDEVFGGAHGAREPAWKRSMPRDSGTDWDFEDVRDFYVAQLHHVDPEELRQSDPARYLDLGRATVAHLFSEVLTEWRRSGSGCDGAVILTLRDLWPGAGWGIVDAFGRPKAPWFSARRVLQPVALLATDEGLNGLDFHVVNDTAAPLSATLTVELLAPGLAHGEHASCLVEVAAHDAVVIRADSIFDGFRDITYAYRFGPPAYDVVVATLTDERGALGRVVYLPHGQERPLVDDLGLTAVAGRAADGSWTLEVATEAFAQWVAIDAPGFRPTDSWFHLPPGSSCEVKLIATDAAADRQPSGTVRALNCGSETPITLN